MRLTRYLGLDTLRGVLRFYTILLISLPVLLAAIFFMLFGRERMIRGELEQLAGALRYEKAVVHFWLDASLGNVSFLAGLDAARQADLATLRRIFINYAETHSHVTAVVYVSPDGYTAVDPSRDTGVFLGDRDYFQAAREGRATVTGVLANRASGTPICVVSAPVTDTRGGFGGVVFMPVEMSSLDMLLGEASPGQSGSVYLADESGRILAPARPIPAAPDQWPRVSPQALQAGEKGRVFTGPDGREMLGASIALHMPGWRLVRELPVEAVVAGYRRQMLWVGAGAAATIILVTPLLLRLCRRLERPLVELARHARELRAGGYEAGCTLVPPPGMVREVDELFAAFCEMGRQVRGHIEEAERLSVQDALTGLYNRRFLFSGGAKLIHAAIRARQPCACLMLDVDHFKQVNDMHGHYSGDQVLSQLAALFRDSVRRSDLVARYGGEEFAILLVGAGLAAAMELGERIRRRVEATPCRIDGLELPATVSIGAAESRELVEYGETPLEDMLARADKALYAAKAAGRNRVRGEAVDAVAAG